MGFAHAIQNLWPFRGPPDPRSEREIDDDLDAEFAFHLEQSARDIINEGHDREAACGLAHERFGDIQRYKLQCRRIALKERIMLQRVNLILMIVVTLMVIGVGTQVWITQRHNTLALQDITAQIAKMRMDAGAEARDRGWSAPGAESAAKVLVEGAVDKPGWYDVSLSSEPTLLHELLSRVSLHNPESLVFHTRSGQSSNRSYNFNELQSDGNKIVLGPGDHIRVQALSGEQRATQSNAPSPAIDPGVPMATSNEQVRQSGFVHLDGDVGRAGTYSLPSAGGLTLQRFFAAAGVPDFVGEVIVVRVENGVAVRHVALMEELRNSPQANMELVTGDQIILRRSPQSVDAANVGVQSAEPTTADPLKRSPFRAVKWTDWTPFVDVQGQWYELIAVDTIPVSVLIEQARRNRAAEPRRVFSSCIVDLLQQSGRTVGDSLRLDVRDITSGTKFAIGEAQLTAENFNRVQKSNEESRAAGEEYPKYTAGSP